MKVMIFSPFYLVAALLFAAPIAACPVKIVNDTDKSVAIGWRMMDLHILKAKSDITLGDQQGHAMFKLFTFSTDSSFKCSHMLRQHTCGQGKETLTIKISEILSGKLSEPANSLYAMRDCSSVMKRRMGKHGHGKRGLGRHGRGQRGGPRKNMPGSNPNTWAPKQQTPAQTAVEEKR